MTLTIKAHKFGCNRLISLPETLLQHPGLIILCIFIVILAGCESTATKNYSSVPPDSWPVRHQQLDNFNQWLMKGKLAVIQPERSDNLVINQWRQANNSFDIHVSSVLLGLGATHIKGTPNSLYLQQTDEPLLHSNDPADLLGSALGWSLPLESLRFWIKGLPSPETPAGLYFDDMGNLFRIDQNQWLVQLDRYQPVGDLLLPGKVTLTKDDVKLKVVITDWNRTCQDC